MTTIEHEFVVPSATEMDLEAPVVFTAPDEVKPASNHTLEAPAAGALPLGQGLPRLLYELAVRLPALPDIQALCVWLYEPVRQAIRLHVLMADLPNQLKAGMDFP